MRAMLAGAFAIGAGLGTLCTWLTVSRKARRARVAEWRSGYLAGYRNGSTQERYEAYEGSD